MTIRFTKSWNGYYEGQIVTSPNGNTEANLVAQNFASYDLDGPDNSPLPVNASKNLTGGIELSAGGVPVSVGAASDKKYRALWRKFGGQAHVAGTGTSLSTGLSSSIKVPFDAPFSAARLWVFSRETGGESQGWRCSFAATETGDMGTAANASIPIVGGTQYNSLAASGNDFGFRLATWGNPTALSSAILYPSDFTAEQLIGGAGSGLSFSVPSVLKSDWTPVRSVPSQTDSRYWMLTRIHGPVSATGTFSQHQRFGNLFQTGLGTRSATWFRDILASGFSSNLDIVTTPAAATGTTYNQSANQTPGAGMPMVGIEVLFDVPVRSVWGIGDSITESNFFDSGAGETGSVSDANWWQRACYNLSTAAAPIVPFNGGLSTNKSWQFEAEFRALVTNGAVPTDVLVPVWSINDYANASTAFVAFEMEKRKRAVMLQIEMVRAVGATPWLWTSPHVLTGVGGSSLAELNGWARQICGTGLANLVDIQAGWNNAQFGAGGHLMSDATHPNGLGQEYMRGVFQTAFAASL